MLQYLCVHFYNNIIYVYFYTLNSKLYMGLEALPVFLEFVFVVIITAK
jgi:hypothetical protein